MPKNSNKNGNGRMIRTQADMDKAVKAINNILRRDKAKGARLYVPELTWMFFLRYLDLMEEVRSAKGGGAWRGVYTFAQCALPVAGLGRAL